MVRLWAGGHVHAHVYAVAHLHVLSLKKLGAISGGITNTLRPIFLEGHGLAVRYIERSSQENDLEGSKWGLYRCQAHGRF